MSIYGVELKPCPFCGESDERKIQIQTPRCDDGRHRDAYMRCFKCGARGPYVSFDLASHEMGDIPATFAAGVWNKRV